MAGVGVGVGVNYQSPHFPAESSMLFREPSMDKITAWVQDFFHPQN